MVDKTDFLPQVTHPTIVTLSNYVGIPTNILYDTYIYTRLL